MNGSGLSLMNVYLMMFTSPMRSKFHKSRPKFHEVEVKFS